MSGSTAVIDCGRYAVRHAMTSRRRAADAEHPPIQTQLMNPTHHEPVGAEDVVAALSQLLSGRVQEDEQLTILPLLHTLAPPQLKEALLYYCFEVVHAKQVCLHWSSVTALFAAGQTSGLVVDAGYSGVRITPVVQGVPNIIHTSQHPSVGMWAVDDSIASVASMPPTQHEVLTSIKAQCCSLEPQWSPSANTQVQLPDGSTINLPCSAEAVAPATQRLLYSTDIGVPSCVSYAYQKVSLEHTDLNTVACIGGGATISGMGGVMIEAMHHTLLTHPPREVAMRDPLQAAVEGALILTRLASFKGLCVSQHDYAEDGPHRCAHARVIDVR